MTRTVSVWVAGRTVGVVGVGTGFRWRNRLDLASTENSVNTEKLDGRAEGFNVKEGFTRNGIEMMM